MRNKPETCYEEYTLFYSKTGGFFNDKTKSAVRRAHRPVYEFIDGA